jgi:TonB family protein
MKKSLIFSIFIHGAFFSAIFALGFFSYRTMMNTRARSSGMISGIGMISNSVNTAQKTTQKKIFTAPLESQMTTNTENSGTANVENSSESSGKTYFSELQAKIQSEQRYPLEARKRNLEDTVEIEFQLNDQGQITEIHSVSGGKAAILVEAAMDAVRDASPFSAPPAGISHDFRIPIEFKIK